MAEKKTNKTIKPATKKVPVKILEKKAEKAAVSEEEVKADLKKADKVKLEKKTVKKSEAKSEPKAKTSEKKEKLKNSEKKHGKNYRKAFLLIEKDKLYEIDEAIQLLKKTSLVKFDATVEMHIRLNIDPAAADQQVRGSLVLPAGTGKKKKVLAIVSPDREKEAKEAGADHIGGEEVIAKIEKGWLDFEVVIATPEMMPKLGKIGKILGTKGLMPNPKVGTVTTEVGKTVKNIKSGMVEYRVDKQGIIHLAIGRVSFSEDKLKENYQEVHGTITKNKPNGVKGTFVKSIYLTTSMGPSIKVN